MTTETQTAADQILAPLSEEAPAYTFDQALAVLTDVCREKEHQSGWIAHTITAIFDPGDLTLDQWLAIADAADKPKKWAYARADENGVL